jgi:hypothetical protein
MFNRNITNYLRHIIYHYYNEEWLNIYDQSLNLNIKYYFDNNKNKSYELISELMSKIFLFYNFKLENAGTYIKNECLKSDYISVNIIFYNNFIGI